MFGRGREGVEPAPSRRTVFVSYARADQEWLRRIETALAPLTRSGDLEMEVFSSDPGLALDRQIEAALRRAAVILVLVSADYLASSFLIDTLLPAMIEQRVPIVPLLVRPSLWQASPLASYQVPNSASLSEMTPPEADRTLVEAAERIATLADATVIFSPSGRV
jgi:hypothetical protein